MPSFECATYSSTKFEADAISAHSVQATAARDPVPESNTLLLFLWSPQHVRLDAPPQFSASSHSFQARVCSNVIEKASKEGK